MVAQYKYKQLRDLYQDVLSKLLIQNNYHLLHICSQEQMQLQITSILSSAFLLFEIPFLQNVRQVFECFACSAILQNY